MTQTTWNFDTQHSSADFAVTHMMFSRVRGSFPDVTGTLHFDPQNPATASVEATIETKTVTTGVADRDNHLRSGDFFDVENYPAMTFKSTGVEVTGDNAAKVTGDLTIRNITKQVVLDVEFLGEGTNPWGMQVGGFRASTKINREDWDLTWNQALEAGGVLVSKTIDIELNVQVVKQTETQPA